MTTPIDLVRQYGSVREIPNADLIALGFQKKIIETDSGICYKIEKESAAKQISEAQKEAPFEKLEVILSKNDVFCSLSQGLYCKVMQLINNLENDIDISNTDLTNFKRKTPPRTSLKQFGTVAEEYLEKKFGSHKGKDYSEADILKSYCRLWELQCDERGWMIDIVPISNQIFSTVLDELALEELVMPKKQVEALYRELEKVRSQLTDVDELKQWQELGGGIFTIEDTVMAFGDDWRELCSPEFVNYITADLGTVYQRLVREVLKDKGFDTITQSLEQCLGIDEYRLFLQSVKGDQLPSFERTKEIQKKIKDAPLEERKVLSQELKQAKEQQKYERQLVEGALNFLSPEVLFAQHMKREFKEIQQILYRQGNDQEQLYLDGRPNKKLDKDPGEVSGDCTRGAPLPFYDSRVHNIKVLKGSGQHIGNIYLFETAAEGYSKVWHLDAIQVPEQADWDKSIEALIFTLAKAAEAKNVSCITVNKIKHLISNFDYIGEAVEKYHREHGGEMTMVDLDINIRPDYSGFQGDGEARVLWKK
ncbi:MAG: hypothetical protein ABH824_06695 [Nanoarchaeota archaeon]|nr:hypothetical protein [Nanoarchaeota archaeon]MBU1631717.1 hypothetical protein [Nanoarchaeota archaeon]MBU1876221.1 hypothetical protein [Nanoarchaeota archaeon]